MCTRASSARGDDRDRTGDLLRATQTLNRLSFVPMTRESALAGIQGASREWREVDSDHRPLAYEANELPLLYPAEGIVRQRVSTRQAVGRDGRHRTSAGCLMRAAAVHASRRWGDRRASNPLMTGTTTRRLDHFGFGHSARGGLRSPDSRRVKAVLYRAELRVRGAGIRARTRSVGGKGPVPVQSGATGIRSRCGTAHVHLSTVRCGQPPPERRQVRVLRCVSLVDRRPRAGPALDRRARASIPD